MSYKVIIKDLKQLGWNSYLDKSLKDLEISEIIPGRIIHQSGKHYKVLTEKGEKGALLSNSFLRSIKNKSEIPAVGDWVGIKLNEEIHISHIQILLPRKNKLSRKVAGKKSEEQIIAANIDTVFIFTSPDQDFNIRRIERYLSMIYDIDALPIIILNKIDTSNDIDRYINKIEESLNKVKVVPISSITGKNFKRVSEFIEPGKTIVLVGSSGVGKSTFINKLLGFNRQAVGKIRASDGKGKHVTTSRELIIVPGGSIIIDNPGIREIQLWSSGEGISQTFEDIEEIGRSCKFRDCRHEMEPGCAVIEALRNGEIEEERLKSYKKLKREQEYSDLRKSSYEKRKKDKQLGKLYRQGEYIRKLRGKK